MIKSLLRVRYVIQILISENDYIGGHLICIDDIFFNIQLWSCFIILMHHNTLHVALIILFSMMSCRQRNSRLLKCQHIAIFICKRLIYAAEPRHI